MRFCYFTCCVCVNLFLNMHTSLAQGLSYGLGILQHLILVCNVCLCPIKRMPGFNELVKFLKTDSVD